MDHVVSIQARMGSTRLPGKVLLPLGENRILDLVRQRCRQPERVSDLVFAIGDADPNAAITEWCRRTGTKFVVGPESNLLNRHRFVASEVDCDTIVRVTGDCPFVPPSEIERLIEEHEASDAKYTTNYTERMPVGTAVDVIEVSLLDALADEGETHPVGKLRDDSSERGMNASDNPEWYEYGDVHMAVDTPTDYWKLTDAIEAVGTEPRAVARWLANRPTD